MAEFDVNRYFKQAAQSIQDSANDPSPWEKLDLQEQPKKEEVAEAAMRKSDLLRQQEAKRKQTWAGQLGLEPDTLAGGAVNVGASIASASSEAVGDLAALPSNLDSMQIDKDVPDDVYQAYSRYKKGEASDRDMAVLGQRTGNELAMRERDGYTPNPDITPTKRTFLDRLEQSDNSRDTAREITDTMDIRSIVDRTAQQSMSAELRAEGADGIAMLDQASQSYENGETFQAAKQAALGLADLVAVGGSALAGNKQAVLEYASEIVPDLVIGAISSPALVARNVGYGLDAYNQGIRNYAEDNNGQMPSEDERRWMAANAFGMALMDTVGDTTLLKSFKKGPKKGKAASAGRAVKKTAGGTAVEGGTEGVQTKMEGEAMARPSSGMDIFEGAVIGAGAGGTVAGVGGSVSEATGNSEEQQQIRQEEVAEERKVDKGIVDEVAEGNYEDLTNPENAEKYPPDRVAVALYKDAMREDATPEQKQASQDALKNMATKLDDAVAFAEDQARSIDPEKRKDLKTKISQIASLIEVREQEGATDAIEPLQEMRKRFQDQLKEGNDVPKAERVEIMDRLKTLKKAQLMATQGRVNMSRAGSDTNAETLVSQAKDKKLNTEERTKAAGDAVTLMMADSGSISPEQAQSLIDDANDILSNEQRDYLRTLSDAAVARNAASTMETVDRDVFSEKARDGFKSLPQYQRAVANAIASGDITAAERQIDGLAEWVRSHEKKADLAKQAIAQVGPGRQMAIWNDPSVEGGWSLEPYAGKSMDKQLRKNGGLSFNTSTKSKELVKAIQGESSAIQATGRELSAAIKLAKSQQKVPSAPAGASTTPAKGNTNAQKSSPQADQQPQAEGTSQEPATGQAETGRATEEPAGEDSEVRDGDNTGAGDQRATVEGRRENTGRSSDGRVAKLRNTVRSWKQVAADLKKVDEAFEVEKKKKDPSVERDVELEDERTNLEDDLNQLILELDDVLEPLLTHRSEAVKEKVKDLLENVYIASDDLQNGTDESINFNEDVADPFKTDEVIRDLNEIGKLANEFDTATPDLFDADTETEQDTDAEPETNQLYGLTFEPVEGMLSTDLFKTTNLVAAYFKARKSGENGQTKQPLTTREDFVSTTLTPAVSGNGESGSLDPYVKDLETVETFVGQRQRSFLRQFADFASRTREYIQSNLKVNPRKEFRYEDFTQFFLDDNGKLPENVTTAISYAAFTWVAENAGAPSVKSEKDVKRMLGLNPEDPLDPQHYRDLRDAGELRSNVLQDLGGKARQALGLSIRKDAPQNHQTQLEQSLGAHALALMESEGMVELWGKHTDAFKNAKQGDLHYFIRPAREEGTSDIPAASDAILQGSKNTEGVLSKLFDVESQTVWPSFTPITEMTQKKAKRTTQDVPSEQAGIVAGEQANKAWMIRYDMKKAIDRLFGLAPETGSKLLYRMGGATDPDSYVSQATNEAGNRGKREAIQREIDYLMEFYNHSGFRNENGEQDYGKKFYFPLSVWSNQRVGIASNTIDPLASKIHRFMMQMPEWEHKVPLRQKGASKKGKHNLRQFKLAVMEGLGEPVDKQTNRKSLRKWDAKLMDTDGNIIDPKLSQMVALALELVEDTGQQPKAEALQELADFVAEREGFHTFDALIHLARFQMAKTWGDTEFRSTLVREGDGITNGPALATILAGAWSSLSNGFALVNKMGIFEKGNKYQSAGAWQEAAENNDLYQTLAVRVDALSRNMRRNFAEGSLGRSQIDGVFGLIGSFTKLNEQGEREVDGAGRKAVKTPLTGMAFGASVRKSIENMGHDVVDSFFNQIEKTLNSNKSDADKVKEVNRLARLMEPLLQSDLGELTLESARKLEFRNHQRQAVVSSFKSTVGQTVATALEEQFGNEKQPNSFIGFRDRMNKVSKDAFDLFMLTRDYEIRQYIDEEKRAGRLPVSNNGEALQAMSGKQLQELDNRIKAINPVVHTAMSKASKQRSAGLHVSKQKMQARYGEAAFHTNVKFNNPMWLNGETGTTKKVDPKASKAEQERKKRERVTLDAYGQTLGYTDPGVRVFITNVHSLDSAIASRTYKDFPALNVHDAEIVAANMMQTVAEQMNQETFKALLDHSLPEEIMTMAFQTFAEFERRVEDMQSDPEFTSQLNERLKRKRDGEIGGIGGVRERLAEGLRVANQAEANKLALLAQIETVNQYGVEGGEYKLTADDYAAVAEKQRMSVSDRVMQTLSRRNRQDGLLVEEALRELAKEADEAPAVSREDADTLNRLHKRFLIHGDVEKALAEVFPGRGVRAQTAQKKRDEWRARLYQQMAESMSPTRSVRQASMPEVLRLVSMLRADRDTPQPTYDALKAFEKYVADPANRLNQSLTQMMAEANGNDLAQAESIVGFMDRNFDQRRQTPWGVLGQPVARPEPRLARALETTPRMPVRDLLRKLDQNVLVRALAKLVDPQLRVHYVNRNTPASFKPDTDVTLARGFWDRRNGNEAIYIKSPDFVDSGVTSELVTHETLHAVLYDAVESDDPRSKKFTQEIELLRALAIRYMKTNGLMDTFGQAVVNNHELIAWGMTNQDFQEKVLAKVTMKTRNKESGLAKFFDAIKTFLFGYGRIISDTGLEALVVNTAGLMNEVSQVQKAKGDVTLKQQFGPTPENMQQWSTEQVYDALEGQSSLDTRTDTRLRSLLSTVVDKVHGPYGAWKAPEGLDTPTEVFIESKATGKMPFASLAQTAFPLSNQQLYVLEQVEVSLREAMASDSLAYKDLVRVFRDARNTIKPSDLDSRDADSAEEKYRMLFDLKQVPGTSRTDHLSRFASLALVEPTVFDALNNAISRQQLEGDGMGDYLKSWYEKTSQTLADHINNTRRLQPNNGRILALSERIADIEAKNRADAARNNIGFMDQVESAGKNLGDKARNTVKDMADSDRVSNNTLPYAGPYIQAIGGMTSTIAGDRVDELMDALEDYRAYTFKQRQGLVGSLITEARGSSDSTRIFHKLLRMAGQNERQRKQIDENVRNDIKDRMETFTKTESEGFTRTVLRTDMSGLLAEYDQETLTSLLDKPEMLNKEIAKWERKVADLKHHTPHYLAYSKLLGHFMVTGKAKGPHMSLNAYNIARLAGTREKALSDKQVKAAEKVLDPLISLYALKETNLGDRRTTASLFKREGVKGKESGVLYAMKLHEKLKEDARKNLFDNDPALFMKGYTREIYNPHREVKVATAAEGAELVAQGWIQKPKHLVHDRTDPDQTEKFLYVMPHGGLNAQVTGSVSYTGTRRKGTAIHGGEFLISEQDIHRENQKTNQQISAMNWRRVRETGKEGRAISPKGVQDNFMVPVFNQDGKIVNYRYLMSEFNKDDILQRNNRAEDILGSMASHMFDKNSTEVQNNQVITALKGQYDIDYQRRPEAFIKVSPDSNDAQARETYHLLPPAAKQAIQDVWGGNAMYVRADVIDMVFGYRKFSLSNMFDKPEVENRVVQAIQDNLVDAIASRWVLGDKAKLRIRQGEDMWQELVKEVKDAWVIKRLGTLISNISSNVSLLLWNGMSPKKIIDTHKTAINGLLDYQKDSADLLRLEREQALEVSPDPKALNQQIMEIKDAIDRNPVKALIDEGMFQTILEDVDAETDNYSYKTRLMEKMDDATAKVPQAIKTGAKWTYMAHDTPLYKLMFKTTQMSDFVARYSLYQHLTTRAKDPMDHDSAIQRIADTFVNYDIPTHRTLQYLNDTGLVFFTKYYMRIQKVLLNLFQEKPARGLLLALFSNYMSEVPTVMESGPRLSNPLDTGALNYPEAVSEILPIKGALSLW